MATAATGVVVVVVQALRGLMDPVVQFLRAAAGVGRATVIPVAGQYRHQLANSHMHPLIERSAAAMTLRHHQTNQCVIVAAFYLRLSHPSGQVDAGRIFAFNDNPLTVQSDTRNIPPVFGT